MNRHLQTVWTVMRKELRDFVRDRRTFLMTLLLGPMLYPALMLGMGKLAESRMSTQLEKPLTIHILGLVYCKAGPWDNQFDSRLMV